MGRTVTDRPCPNAECATFGKTGKGNIVSIGSEWQLRDALERSEDSDRLNTSFVERLHLTIRQGSAYLQRRSPAHARLGQCLAGQLELLRCYYNFVRPHMALRFGSEVRTPAMQAGLATRRLTFRDVFTAAAGFLLLVVLAIRVRWRRQELVTGPAAA